jgi:tetratricopeptide (TPR) repeat protein
MVSSLRRLRFYRAVAMAALLLTEPIMPGLAQSESKCTGNPDVPPEREIAGRTNAIQSGKYSGKDLSWAYHNRGSAHYGKGDFDPSIADYSEAVRLDPKSASAYGGRGLAYFDKGDFDRAIADYNEAIKLDPKSASFYNKSASVYYNGRGATYSDKSDYDRAIADYSEAIRFDPKFIPAYTNRGDAYSTKGDYERAIAAYSEAINVDPKSVIAYLHRGLAYFDKGDDDRAIADSTEAIKRDGKSVFAYQVRGIVYLYANSLAQAQADFKQATELSPKYAYAALWLSTSPSVAATCRAILLRRQSDSTWARGRHRWYGCFLARRHLPRCSPPPIMQTPSRRRGGFARRICSARNTRSCRTKGRKPCGSTGWRRAIVPRSSLRLEPPKRLSWAILGFFANGYYFHDSYDRHFAFAL